ncbi:MAG: hypothetical protein RLZZ502_494 [Pseudomonadota bacterium]|jgi:PhnB protein
MNIPFTPAGYHSLTPYAIYLDCKAAIAFYEQAFGATKKLQIDMGSAVGHAEIIIGNSHLMMSDESVAPDLRSPDALGGSSVFFMIYVADADAAIARAVAAGAKLTRPLENHFYGDRSGTVVDPFGYHWTLATHIEDVDEDELNRRLQKMMNN